jgi:hypothetical protein
MRVRVWKFSDASGTNYVPIFRVMYTLKMGTKLVPGAPNHHTWRGCGPEKKFNWILSPRKLQNIWLLPTVGRCDFWVEERCLEEMFSICEMKYAFKVQVRVSLYNSNKSTNYILQFLKFITWRLCAAKHVSGVLTPITRSSTTAVAASGFTVGAWW